MPLIPIKVFNFANCQVVGTLTRPGNNRNISQDFRITCTTLRNHKGIINTKWCEWVEQHKDKFTVHHLNHSYANSSFRKSDKVTDEVLIVSK